MTRKSRSDARPPAASGSAPQRPRQGRRLPGLGGLSPAVAVRLGMAGGLGAFTFGYGKGFSYLVDDPQACANCHVMDGHFDSWRSRSWPWAGAPMVYSRSVLPAWIASSLAAGAPPFDT